MMPTRTECPLKLQRKSHDRCRVDERLVRSSAGRVPRVSRLLALAHKFDGLMRQGVITHYAALAHLGHVSRARVSQIMALTNLAPDIQEAILFLPLTARGRDVIHLRQLLAIARLLDWCQQRLLWRQFTNS
jgi:hypothetical protein